MLEAALRRRHDAGKRLLPLEPGRGLEDESHPAPRHSPEHPEAPKAVAEAGPDRIDERLGVGVARPGDDGAEGACEVAGRGGGDPPRVAGGEAGDDLVEHLSRLDPRTPLRFAAEEVFLGHHLEDRTDVLGHAAMDEDERFLKIDAQRHGVMSGEEAAATDPELRIPLGGDDPADELRGRPHPAGILPPAATPAEPLTENRPGRHETPLLLVEPACERAGLAGGPHADTDQRGEEVCRNGEPRSLRNPVDRADELQAMPGADHGGKNVGKRLSRSLDPRWHDPRSDHRRLQQPEVIPAEIEHLAEIGDVGRGVEVDARQPQQRLVDDPEIDLHRRPGGRVTAVHAEVDRHVENAGGLGAIHPQEEDVAPAGVRQIHPHRRRFLEERERRPGAGRPAFEQLGSDAERMVVGMPDPEHPLIATDRPHRLPHLIGERLQAKLTVGAGKGARQGR